jgi:hypothetical protein
MKQKRHSLASVRRRREKFAMQIDIGRLLGSLAAVLTCGCLLQPDNLSAQTVAVRHTEGLLHGFLVLRTMDGKTIADGDTTQFAQGNRVTSRLTFRFKDGSLFDETTVFTQRGAFRLVRDHLTQKGPSFKRSLDAVVDASTGQVTVHYTDDKGKENVLTERLDLAPDVANGLLPMLLNDIQPTVARTTLSMVATTPKPRLVKLVITPQGEEPFSVGSLQFKSTHYVVKVDIGGVAGVVAPIVGKQPPDTHIWMLGGVAPAFIKSEGPLEDGGAIWRIEFAGAAVFKAGSAKQDSVSVAPQQNQKK